MKYNNKLPAEILQEIFRHLESNKDDLENCLLVCKLWNSVASGLFWDKMLFNMNSTSRCRQLLDVISRENSTLALKVQHLDYEVCEESDEEELDEPISTFTSIINLCDNITQLCLLSGEVYQVLKELLNQQENIMPYIQFLNLQPSEDEFKKDVALKSLHICANYKHRKSITYLLLPDLNASEDIFKEYGGINRYLLEFPVLDKFECEYVQGVNFDLPVLLENSRCLKDIELYGECHLTTQRKINIDDDQMMPSRSSALKHIHFRFAKLDLDTIKYLTKIIKDIHVISLLPSFSNRTGQIEATKEDATDAFNKFTQQCIELGRDYYGHDHDHAHVLFRNGDQVVSLGKGDDLNNPYYHGSSDEDDSEWEAEMERERMEEWEERQMYREIAYQAMLEEEEDEEYHNSEDDHQTPDEDEEEEDQGCSENDDMPDVEDEDLSDKDDHDYEEDELEEKEVEEHINEDEEMLYEEDNDSELDELSYEED